MLAASGVTVETFLLFGSPLHRRYQLEALIRDGNTALDRQSLCADGKPLFRTFNNR
jgi:hypothetical protein